MPRAIIGIGDCTGTGSLCAHNQGVLWVPGSPLLCCRCKAHVLKWRLTGRNGVTKCTQSHIGYLKCEHNNTTPFCAGTKALVSQHPKELPPNYPQIPAKTDQCLLFIKSQAIRYNILILAATKKFRDDADTALSLYSTSIICKNSVIPTCQPSHDAVKIQPITSIF